MFKYIIFDFDNTIYNYDLANSSSLSKVFADLSKDYNIPLDNVINAFNIQKIIFQNHCYNHASCHNKFIQIKKLFEFLKLDITYVDKYYQKYINYFNEKLELYPYLIDFLIFCKNHSIKMYILTNNICREQINKLNQLYITQYFEKIYTSEELGIEKPDIKIYNHIIADIGCNKNEIVKIGDNYQNDILPSSYINIYSFWFNKNNSVNKEYLEFNNYQILLFLFENYYENANEFVKLSKYVGERFDLVQAGGGNTSFKLDNLMFVKSSGCLLSDINLNTNYVCVDFKKIREEIKTISHQDKRQREVECNNIISDSTIFLKQYKPSIETSLHTLTKKYTVHIHPIQFNLISSSKSCNEIVKKIFHDDNYIIIDYFTPGIDVSIELLNKYSNEKIIFLKNHGIVFTSDTIYELYKIIEITMIKLESFLKKDYNNYKFTNCITKSMNTIFNSYHTSYFSEDSLVNKFINQNNEHSNIFTTNFPDKLVYCGISYVKINSDTLEKDINDYYSTYHEKPKIFIVKREDIYYLYICSNSLKNCINIESVLKSHFICYNSENNQLSKEEIYYLNNWDAEKYRQNMK